MADCISATQENVPLFSEKAKAVFPIQDHHEVPENISKTI